MEPTKTVEDFYKMLKSQRAMPSRILESVTLHFDDDGLRTVMCNNIDFTDGYLMLLNELNQVQSMYRSDTVKEIQFKFADTSRAMYSGAGSNDAVN